MMQGAVKGRSRGAVSRGPPAGFCSPNWGFHHTVASSGVVASCSVQELREQEIAGLRTQGERGVKGGAVSRRLEGERITK